jgi:phosphoglycerate dehydrogenase-like enzyme
MTAPRLTIGITDYVRTTEVETAAFPEATFVMLDESTPISDWRSLDALLVWHQPITAEVVARLDQCKVVVRYGVGFDAIDIAALQQRGIPFCNTPDYGTEEVADTACAMALSLQRKVVEYDRAARTYSGGWQEHTRPPLRRMNTQTFGVIGVGRIGTAAMNRMRPFGYGLAGFDPYQPSGHEKAIGYTRYRRLDDLLAAADIVSIHCPLTRETRGLVDRATLAAMKPGAILINTARGEIVADLDCLEAALRSGQLSAVGLDVLPQEPPPGDHALIRAWKADEEFCRGRLLINPHSAYYSDEAWYEMRYKAAETARNHVLAS